MKNLVLILLVFMAGCVTTERTFSKMDVSFRQIGTEGSGTFEATLERYLVSDLDETYFVMYFPTDKETFNDIMHESVNISEEVISGIVVSFNYVGEIDDEPHSLNAYIGGHAYQIGTDSPVTRKDVLIDLFKFYFDLR